MCITQSNHWIETIAHLRTKEGQTCHGPQEQVDITSLNETQRDSGRQIDISISSLSPLIIINGPSQSLSLFLIAFSLSSLSLFSSLSVIHLIGLCPGWNVNKHHPTPVISSTRVSQLMGLEGLIDPRLWWKMTVGCRVRGGRSVLVGTLQPGLSQSRLGRPPAERMQSIPEGRRGGRARAPQRRTRGAESGLEGRWGQLFPCWPRLLPQKGSASFVLSLPPPKSLGPWFPEHRMWLVLLVH